MFDSFETRSFTKLCYPLLIDWRSIIILPKVPLQRAATYSCWAVATVVAIEAKYAILTGKQIKFSTQELLDCCPNTCLGWTHVVHMYAKYIGFPCKKITDGTKTTTWFAVVKMDGKSELLDFQVSNESSSIIWCMHQPCNLLLLIYVLVIST